MLFCLSPCPQDRAGCGRSVWAVQILLQPVGELSDGFLKDLGHSWAHICGDVPVTHVLPWAVQPGLMKWVWGEGQRLRRQNKLLELWEWNLLGNRVSCLFICCDCCLLQTKEVRRASSPLHAQCAITNHYFTFCKECFDGFQSYIQTTARKREARKEGFFCIK